MKKNVKKTVANSKTDKTDTIKKKKPTRRESKTAANKKKFLEMLVHEDVLGNVTYACKRLSLSRAQVYTWAKTDKKFDTAWKSTQEEADNLLVDEAENALLRGIRNTNPTLIIFTLKNRKPDRWRDRFEHTGKDGNAIEHEMSPEFAKFLETLGYGKTDAKKAKPRRS